MAISLFNRISSIKDRGKVNRSQVEKLWAKGSSFSKDDLRSVFMKQSERNIEILGFCTYLEILYELCVRKYGVKGNLIEFLGFEFRIVSA